MLKIAKSNSETSNNNIKLVVATLAINVTRLVAITLAISIAGLAATITVLEFYITWLLALA